MGFKEHKSADRYIFVAVAALLLSFVSFIVAFPIQVILVVLAATKARVCLIPAIFIMLLDPTNFHAGTAMKLRLGIALSVQNVFLITIFFFSLAAATKKRIDASTAGSFIPWISTIVPALWMGLEARGQGLTANWQQPFVLFLTPALYFWGVAIAKTWDEDKEYFFKRMIPLMAVVNMMEFFELFSIFTFSEHISMICLFIGGLFSVNKGIFRLISGIGMSFALLNVLFGRYFSRLEATGYASSVDVGSTFTRLMVVVIGVFLALCFARRVVRKSIKTIPYFALAICVLVFSYSVIRARSGGLKFGGADVRNWAERFEYKLIGDRGALWASCLEEVFSKPLFFKKLGDQITYVTDSETGALRQDVKLLPHNQVLTLLITAGWWQGLFCIMFMWWTHTRAFKAGSLMSDERDLLCGLLAPSAAVFISVGLTGQAVFSSVFCGNGLVTMVYPGIVYGVWRIRMTACAPLGVR